ncbi:hypothetical protein [Xanthomonas phage RTH11]|nr:hypothetical protein [Xanthomonas phage RTH11]
MQQNEFLLLTKNPDEAILLDPEGKTPLTFTNLREPLVLRIGETATVLVAALRGYDYLTGANVHQGSPTMHHMLHHALDNPGVLDLQGMYRELCTATRLKGEAYVLVRDDQGTVHQLVLNDQGDIALNTFAEPAIYQQGRVISEYNLLAQLDAAQAKRIDLVKSAFNPTLLDTGFIMPRID